MTVEPICNLSEKPRRVETRKPNVSSKQRVVSDTTVAPVPLHWYDKRWTPFLLFPPSSASFLLVLILINILKHGKQ